jgi:hypothetical protein
MIVRSARRSAAPRRVGSDQGIAYTWVQPQRLAEIVARDSVGGAVTRCVPYQNDRLDQCRCKDVDPAGDGAFEKRDRFIRESAKTWPWSAPVGSG